jgi:hypothetical protein
LAAPPLILDGPIRQNRRPELPYHVAVGKFDKATLIQALLRGREPMALEGKAYCHAYRKWQGPHWTLVGLATIGYRAGDASLRPLMASVEQWLFDGRHLAPPATTTIPGQEDRIRRCASQEGNAIWCAVTLGLETERTVELVDRLVRCQWPDGGWNCDRRPQARASSLQETAIPARGLWAYGKRHGYQPAIDAADRAAQLMLSRRLLWRRRDGALIAPDWGGPFDLIHLPIQFYDVLFALLVMAELGRAGDPRCHDALTLLESKRLPDGGFPAEYRNATTSSRVASRGTFADWGPSGRTRSNPLVTETAERVLAATRA